VNKIRTGLYLISIVVFLSVAGTLIYRWSSTAQVQSIVSGFGIWGPVFLTVMIALGGIIVPLTALPFILAGLPLYGFWATLLFFYLGNTIIAPVVDFYIARRWGRPAVAKLAGKKAVNEMDKIAKTAGWEALIPMRIFGGVLFDSISYAMGLTSISFKKYLIITLLCPIPGHLLMFYLFQKGQMVNPVYFAVIVVWGWVAALLTPYLIYRYKSKTVAV